MTRLGNLVLQSLVLLSIANPDVVNARSRKAPRLMAQVGENKDSTAKAAGDAPQEFVVCTGWHALCSASPDCKVIGDKANCDCLRVNETHIVETAAIQDAPVKRQTRGRCSNGHPCALDQAPVCKAIKDGRYTVDNVRYDWVSTYSYRGWCGLLEPKPVPCDQSAPGYSGDASWAICDAAPCTEIRNPSNPDKPLRCQCRIETSPFVGAKGTCTGENGGIISSFPLSAWDFEKNTYTFPMPGYEYVRGACARLKSDPFTEPRRGSEPR